MIKLLAVLISLSLVWVSSPVTALAQLNAGMGAVSATPVGAPGSAGAAALSSQQNAGASLSVPAQIRLNDLSLHTLPSLSQPSVTPIIQPENSAGAASTLQMIPQLGSASESMGTLTAQAGAFTPAAPAVAGRQAAGPSLLPVQDRVSLRSRRSGVTPRVEPGDPRAEADTQAPQAAVSSQLHKLGRDLVDVNGVSDTKSRLDEGFEGRTTQGDVDAPVVVSGQEDVGRGMPAQLGPSVSPAVEAVTEAKKEVEVPQAAETPEKQLSFIQKLKEFPFSYWMYLSGQYLYAVGQESAALITPLFAYKSEGINIGGYALQGLGFALLAQMMASIGQISGGLVGARFVKKWNSKNVYLVANVLHTVTFLMVPALFFFAPAIFPFYLMFFKFMGGFIYGAIRGVAEKEITTRIIGQKDKGLLQRAGALFYAVFEGAELTGAIVTAMLLAALSPGPVALIMSLVMALSFIPLRLIKFKKQSGKTEEGAKEEGGTETKLPWMLYLPFIFAFLIHISLYDFFVPFLGPEVFAAESFFAFINPENFGALMIGFYTLGSMLISLISLAFPKPVAKISEKKWTAIGIATVLAYLWGTVLVQNPLLSLGLSVLLGGGLTAMQIQWRALYQRRLRQDVQPQVYNKLNLWTVVGSLGLFGVLNIGLLSGIAMVDLLVIVCGLLTAAALGVPAVNSLWKKFARRKSSFASAATSSGRSKAKTPIK